ncbi:hypothetical protein PAHAL_9G278700 [Panicum hallii]|uniref:Uncharacterized protein n=1 Tax=Panicum hallii TaxID=206008 RepID=A0A2T8I2T2_9POAL|nr:hypothetical protein PAHAL_9G278700 [Panicum hallii]
MQLQQKSIHIPLSLKKPKILCYNCSVEVLGGTVDEDGCKLITVFVEAYVFVLL